MSIADDLPTQYSTRFSGREQYRDAVWKILTKQYFSSLIPPNSAVLDLGCGWGEFINNIPAREKYGMDLNADSPAHLSRDVQFLNQNCAEEWALPDACLDIVFTSNFFEHLPTKDNLNRTLAQAWRCLRDDGKIICLGPNLRYLNGKYWDFYDHYLPLTEMSLSEGLRLRGFEILTLIDRFLPYTMSAGRLPPLVLVTAYLKLPIAWRFFGKQFLVVGKKGKAPKTPPQ